MGEISDFLGFEMEDSYCGDPASATTVFHLLGYLCVSGRPFNPVCASGLFNFLTVRITSQVWIRYVVR